MQSSHEDSLRNHSLVGMVRCTLLIGTLVACSGWADEAWNVAYKITEPESIRSARFSDDDRFLIVNYVDFSVVPAANCLDVRNAETGERVGLLTNPNGSRRETRDSFGCDIHGSYALLADSESHQSRTAKLFNWETRAELPLQEKVGALGGTPLFFVLGQNTLEVPEQSTQFALRLPGLETVAAIAAQSSGNALTSRWLAVLTFEGNILIQHLDTQKTETIAAANPHGYFVGYAETHDILTLRTKNNEGFQLIDVATGKSTLFAKMDYLSLSLDGKRALAIQEREKPLQIIDVASGKVLKDFQQTGHGEFRPDGSVLALLGMMNNPLKPSFGLYSSGDYNLVWHRDTSGTQVENPDFVMVGSRFHTQDSRETDWVLRPMWSGYVINAELVDARTGALSFDFKSEPFRQVADRDSHIEFAHSHPAFAVWADDGTFTNGGFMGKTQGFKGSQPAQKCALIWRRIPAKQ